MTTSLPPPNDSGPKPQLSAVNGAAGSSITDKFITADPAVFAKQLKSLDNDNEVLIVLKEAGVPQIAKSTLKKIPAGGSIALHAASASAPRRATPGFARVNSQSRQAVKDILNSGKVVQFKAPDFGNVITAKIPENDPETIIKALLDNPNVDYIEANQSYPVQFDSGPAIHIPNFTAPAVSTVIGNPQGSNPSDLKHTFHHVLDAWDYTRGSGAKVGILDSGFSYDQGTNSYHPDGQLLSSTKGIEKKGFVDDFDDFGNCNNAQDQPYGNCLPWDDNYNANGPDAHGTAMAGIVGENDNNQGYVGIMPDGLTVSMKMAQNCYITQGCANDNDTYNLESDDFYWAVTWARNNDIDVLSMSFTSSDISSTVYNALYDAYHNDDILLLSSSGNEGDRSDQKYPESYDFVMGVGGLNSDGSPYGEQQYQEVSALSGGGTFSASCATNISFCKPNGYQEFYAPFGGTSASTAITAGIAGLVRAYNPSLTAPQVRQQLINTSTGYYHQVNALRSVTNNPPLTVGIDGPHYIQNSGVYSWEAAPDGGDTGSYSYQWEFKPAGGSYTPVSTSKTYSRFVTTNGQNFTLRVTATSGSEQGSSILPVSVTNGDCPPGQICPAATQQ